MNETDRDWSERLEREASRSSDIDTLVAALRNRSGAVRERARESLIEIGEPAVDRLIEALREPDHRVQWEAAKALGEIADPAAAPELANQLDHTDFGIRWLAAEGLIAIGREALKPLLAVVAERGEDQSIRDGAHHVLHDLAKQDLREEVSPVIEALEGPDPDVEAPRAARLALYGSAGAPDELEEE